MPKTCLTLQLMSKEYDVSTGCEAKFMVQFTVFCVIIALTYQSCGHQTVYSDESYASAISQRFWDFGLP